MKTNQKTRVLASALTASVALTVACMSTEQVHAEYVVDALQEDCSTWDGISYTFDWYETPVIENGVTTYTIASASDLAGLYVLTNDLSASEFSDITSNITAGDVGYIASVDNFEGKAIKLARNIDLADFDWMPISYPWATANRTAEYEFINSETYTIKTDWVDDHNDDHIITYYEAAGVVGAIDQSNLTITMPVPLSKQDELEGVVPDEIEWIGKTLDPSEDEAITLEDGLVYTVTAENGNSKTYTVKIEWIDDRNTDCIITAYKVCGVDAVIDQDNLTINLEIPEVRMQHCTNIAPDVVVWYGSELSSTATAGVDLTDNLVYRVYAENRDIYKDYVVNVVWIKDDETGELDPDDPEDNPNTGHSAVIPALMTIIAAGVVTFTSKRKRDEE